MPVVHFLNVGDGDCSIIQHGSGRITVVDICNGESATHKALLEEAFNEYAIGIAKTGSGNYGMRKHVTLPISYMKRIGISKVFRFILTHPDMDHMDGFKKFCNEIGFLNFWDSGVRRAKPDFSGGIYNEGDWDHYVKVRDGKCGGVKVVTPKAVSSFQYANLGDQDDQGDCLDIVAPDSELVLSANGVGDPNDASYVLVFRTFGGKIIFPGDAHDNTWKYVLNNHSNLVENCAVLIAPHHGRHSARSFDFLDVLKPKLTLFGCANSKHLAYDDWNNRSLAHITNNQAGNILLNGINEGIEVYVENFNYAQNCRCFDNTKTLYGCFYIGLVSKE